MKPLTKLLAGALLALGCFGAFAQAAPGKAVVIHPSIPPVTSVKDAPFPGWLELEASGKTFYLSADGRYMMLGKVIDLGAKPGAVQPAAQAPAAKIDTRALPLQNAIRFVNGNGKRKVFIWSDPDCPFCRQLEAEIPKITDATVYVFPYPLASLHSNARAKAIGVWCQPDRATAWRETMIRGRSYSGTCANPVDANVELGMNKLRVFGTPTIFNSDGDRIEGLVPVEEINRFIK